MSASENATLESPSDASAALGESLAYLVVFDGEACSIFRPPPSGTITIGRGQGAELRLDGADVSRAHAELSVFGGRLVLADLGSQNGTRLNGQPVVEPQELRAGDVIAVGSCRLIFHARGVASAERRSPSEAHTYTFGGHQVLVIDPVMVETYELVRRLAPTHLPVLVHGETGTGKELVASALHHWSARAAGPMVSINCAALPESLAESELFGAERGAYSGLATPKAGLIESAAGGTLFFDEIGELPLGVQAKLLRVLETKRVARLGEVQERPLDLRVVAATHRDLAAECEAGQFRHDLFFRLSAATIWLPPLRERPADLPVLTRALLERAAAATGRPAPRLSEAAQAALAAHAWPGNVRELKNALEYLVATARNDEITAGQVRQRLGGTRRAAGPAADGPTVDPPPTFRPIEEELRELEANRMLAALTASKGNQTAAANLLRMPRRTFVAKMKAHGLRARLGRPAR